MTMIARNNRSDVERCFSSWWDAVDEAVIVIGGRSRDGTVPEARRFARERGEPSKLIVGHFKWIDDFSAAHNYADSLATGDLLTFCDMDETVEGAERLREIAERNPDLMAFAARRDPSHPDDYTALSRPGFPVTGQGWRCVMIRAGSAAWKGSLHNQWYAETQGRIPPSVCRWLHHKRADRLKRTYRLYERVARKAATERPTDPRAAGELAGALLEAIAFGFSDEREEAIAAGERFFALPDWRSAAVPVAFIAARLYAEMRATGRKPDASLAATALAESISPSSGVGMVPIRL